MFVWGVVGGVCCPLPAAERETGAVSIFLPLHWHAHQGLDWVVGDG